MIEWQDLHHSELSVSQLYALLQLRCAVFVVEQNCHYENGHAVEQRNLPDVASLYAVMQEQFGLGVDDAKHGFTVDELALVMAAFDTHPEAGK